MHGILRSQRPFITLDGFVLVTEFRFSFYSRSHPAASLVPERQNEARTQGQKKYQQQMGLSSKDSAPGEPGTCVGLCGWGCPRDALRYGPDLISAWRQLAPGSCPGCQ